MQVNRVYLPGTLVVFGILEGWVDGVSLYFRRNRLEGAFVGRGEVDHLEAAQYFMEEPGLETRKMVVESKRSNVEQ